MNKSTERASRSTFESTGAMALSGEQGYHDGLAYFLQQAKRMSFGEVQEAFLPRVRAQDDTYDEAWEEADKLYSERYRATYDDWNLMEKECYLALICYTLEYPSVCRDLNEYCREACPTNDSWNAFPYKSLFYFLIQAFKKLPPFHGGTFYRGARTFEVKSYSEVPFVQFVSASVSRSVASRFGSYLLELNGVPSTVVRDIRQYSCYEHHQEVLIWPFCTFELVEEVVKPAGALNRIKKTLLFRSAKPKVDYSGF